MLDTLLGGRNSITEAVAELEREIDGDQTDTARRIQGFLRIVNQYAGVVDVLAQHSPEVISLGWWAMRLVIDVLLTFRVLRDGLLIPLQIGLNYLDV